MSTEQEQSLDLQAMASAKTHMGEFAMPTVWLGIATALVYTSALVGYVSGTISFLAALLPLSFATYAIYTVMHDALHRSIQGERRHLSWLNEGLGYLSGQVLMIPFTVHRRSHLAHHAHTNEKDDDPDFSYHSIGKSFTHLVYHSARTGVDQYGYYFKHCWSKASDQEKTKVVLETLGALSWRVALVVYGPWVEVLSLLTLSAVLGSMITIYFFAYLVHRPYEAIGRWVDTGSYVYRKKWGVVVDWLWLFQNYHAIHHLYPRVPFYRYRQLFDEIESVMLAKESPITYHGGAKPGTAALSPQVLDNNGVCR